MTLDEKEAIFIRACSIEMEYDWGDTEKNFELLKLIIDHPKLAGVNLNSFNEDNGYTPLTLAASINRPRCIKLLLEHGADVNALNNDGYAAIHCAARNYAMKALELLLETPNIQVNLKNGEDGKTALQIVREYKNTNSEIIDLLKKHGAEEL